MRSIKNFLFGFTFFHSILNEKHEQHFQRPIAAYHLKQTVGHFIVD